MTNRPGQLITLALCLGALGCSASRVSSHQIQQLRTEPTSCATVKSSDSTIYDTTQVTEKPVPRTVPTLEYPVEARHRRLKGHAVVTAVVSPDGAVEAASVAITMSAEPLLDAEARRIVSLATFWPACREGQAVRARIAVPFDFTLSADPAAVAFAVVLGVWTGIMAAVLH